MSNLASLEAARGQIIEKLSTVSALLAGDRRELARQEANLQFATTAQQKTAIQGTITTLKVRIAQNVQEETRLLQELADIDRQIAAARLQQGPRDSAGETVARAQRANDDRADTISPAVPPAVAAAGITNADRFQPDEAADTGTNAAVTPLTDSQSLPSNTARPGAARQTVTAPNSPGQRVSTADDAVIMTQQGGVGSAGDDSAGGAGVTARINSIFGGDAGRIIPQANPLDGLASYTYSISIYLLSPDDYKVMLTKKILPKSWQLILQSAGAPTGGGIIPGSQLDVTIEDPVQAATAQRANLGRNEFFNLDYYIDDLAIKHLIPNRGTGSPHMSTEMSFKIYEPNGITFLPNLYNAVQQYVALRGGQPSVRNQVYTSQNFVMVIRFYGYDDNGNLVTATNKNNQINSSSGLILQEASNATIEKYIPFQFTHINFRVQNKITEYDCKAICPQNVINNSSTRGVIPYNIELSSQSLKELLTGPINFVSGTKSAGAGAQVVDTGDETARLLARYPAPAAAPGTGYNPRQAQLQSQSTAAPTAPPNSSAPVGAAPAGATTAGSSTPVASPAPAKADAATRARNLTISQGLQEALNRFQAEISGEGDEFPQQYPDIYEIEIAEDAIASAKLVPPGEFNPRQSAMIRAQTAKEAKDGTTQSMDTNSKTEKVVAGMSIVQFIDKVCRTSSYVLDQQLFYIDSVTGKTIENATPAQTVGWYRIGLEAEPTSFYDTKRNDFQYRIKYSVAAYQVNEVKSDYFPRTQFQGTHKVYNYWFTGENTQILNFEQSFNNLYYIVQNQQSRPKRTSNYLEADRFYYQPLNPESSQGQENMRVYDGAASAASWLYSPSDQATVKLSIVGDPAWIFQGEVAFGIQDLKTNYRPFLPDGTINPTGREILFEIVFNQPIDYDLSTGLMDAGKFNFGTNKAARDAGVYSTTVAGLARERYIYRARTCTSFFRQGRFTQELDGAIITFPMEDPNPSQQANRQESQDKQNAAAVDASSGRTPVKAPMPGRTYTTPGTAGRSTPPPGDTFRVDDYFPTPSEDVATPLPQQPTAAPTSSGQVVGQPGTPVANQALGGATGRAVGSPPTVNLYLSNGETVQVTSQVEIAAYAGLASPQARNAAAARLNIAQQAASTPTNNTTPPLRARDF